uniref:GatA-binding transcription factor n=1 Tax=Schistosoma mansoni TaxID=6183 RepID=A0A5K4FEB0_SCHMA
MHNERRSFRSNLDSNLSDTIRVVACKQNQDLQITFANDYACSDRPRPTGSKIAYSASGSGLRDTNAHKMQRQAVISAHKGPQHNRNYENDATFVATPMDSHTQVSYGHVNRRPSGNKSEFDYQNNRRPTHGMHSMIKDQEQYNRDLMTQYEINRALFLANPPPSVLASRIRGRGNNNNIANDSRRIDIQKNSLNQPILNGSRMDRSTVFRSTSDQQRSVFPSKSMKERGFYNLDSEHDSREVLSKNSRGLTRHSRVHFQNNFRRGQGSRQYWGHDDRFGIHENTPGIRVQNSFHNGDFKSRHHSGDEYIDDLTPEDIAKYKLEINMDNFIVDRPILPDPILSVPLSKWQSDDLLLGSDSSKKFDKLTKFFNCRSFTNEFQKQPRSLNHHYQHQHRPHHHYYNHPNNRYHPPHHKQPQKNYSNAHYTQLYNSSRKEPVRPNNKIRDSYSSGYNTRQYQTNEENKTRCSTNNDKIPVSEMNISEDSQVGTDEPIQTNDPTEDSPYFELDFASGIFDVQIHERARSFLTLGIDDSELSQNDCYTNISELSTHGMHRSHSLPSLRDLERNYQLHSFEDCTTPTTSLNTGGIEDLSTKIKAATISVETTYIKSENNVNVSSASVCGSDVAQECNNMEDENRR